MAVVLSAQNISWHSQGRAIIDDISFDVAPGDIVALLGPNGAGKTTLLRCLSGYFPPAKGRVLINGQARMSIGARARAMAYMPQKAVALMSMSVAQAVMLGRKPYLGFAPNANDRRVVEQCMVALELEHLANTPLQLISAGEYQRMLLARLLAQQTGILLLDEPLNNLDPAHQLKLLILLQSLAWEQGRAIVLSMHDLSMASRFCTRALLLSQGRCLAQGICPEVLTPGNLRAAYGIDMRILHTDDGFSCYLPALCS